MTISTKITVYLSIWLGKMKPPMTIDSQAVNIDTKTIRTLGQFLSYLSLEFQPSVPGRVIFRTCGTVSEGLLVIVNNLPWHSVGEKNYLLQNLDHIFIVRIADINPIAITTVMPPLPPIYPNYGNGGLSGKLG